MSKQYPYCGSYNTEVSCCNCGKEFPHNNFWGI